MLQSDRIFAAKNWLGLEQEVLVAVEEEAQLVAGPNHIDPAVGGEPAAKLDDVFGKAPNKKVGGDVLAHACHHIAKRCSTWDRDGGIVAILDEVDCGEKFWVFDQGWWHVAANHHASEAIDNITGVDAL